MFIDQMQLKNRPGIGINQLMFVSWSVFSIKPLLHRFLWYHIDGIFSDEVEERKRGKIEFLAFLHFALIDCFFGPFISLHLGIYTLEGMTDDLDVLLDIFST